MHINKGNPHGTQGEPSDGVYFDYYLLLTFQMSTYATKAEKKQNPTRCALDRTHYTAVKYSNPNLPRRKMTLLSKGLFAPVVLIQLKELQVFS